MSQPWPRTMPALITPFDPNQRIDTDAHRHNVTTAGAAGADGILIAGSTGEGPYLEPGERGALVNSARETSSSLTIVCGISAETDRDAVRQIAESAAAADAALVITPGTLVRGKTDLIADYYERIADLSPLPILLYTNPVVTGYEIPVATVRRLARHQNIVGMKDSGGDTSRLDEMDDVLASGFVVYIGSSKHLAESTSRGAFGAITASANYAFAMVDAAAARDPEAQAALATVTSAVQRHGVPGTKYAASLAGMVEGRARLPLQPLSEQAKQAIAAAYEQMLASLISDG
jgi:dihydrodipicolinate synthase/N-acetylneuraminate lyase